MHLTADELTETQTRGIDIEQLTVDMRRLEMLAKLKQCTGSINATLEQCEGSAISRISKKWQTITTSRSNSQ